MLSLPARRNDDEYNNEYNDDEYNEHQDHDIASEHNAPSRIIIVHTSPSRRNNDEHDANDEHNQDHYATHIDHPVPNSDHFALHNAPLTTSKTTIASMVKPAMTTTLLSRSL